MIAPTCHCEGSRPSGKCLRADAIGICGGVVFSAGKAIDSYGSPCRADHSPATQRSQLRCHAHCQGIPQARGTGPRRSVRKAAKGQLSFCRDRTCLGKRLCDAALLTVAENTQAASIPGSSGTRGFYTMSCDGLLLKYMLVTFAFDGMGLADHRDLG